MDGLCIGVFGTDQTTKAAFEAAVAKKSEAEGLAIYHRTEGGRRLSFLDTADYPERIQGYSRIASLSDHALYFFPRSGSLTAPDGELAVLLGAFGLDGTIELVEASATRETALASLKGTRVAEFRVEERQLASSVFDVGAVSPRPDFGSTGTLAYVDRAFSVKGVGTVALGFVLSGKVSVHDSLRPIPAAQGVKAEVKGIQVNDVDFDSAGRGIRVGLSLRGVEPKDLERSRWLDDGSFTVGDSVPLKVSKSPFYKQPVESRDLHLQLPGEILPARLTPEPNGLMTARLPSQVPVWDGMRSCVVDLNGKSLRVAAGAACKF